jgi:hypothetical protein
MGRGRFPPTPPLGSIGRIGQAEARSAWSNSCTDYDAESGQDSVEGTADELATGQRLEAQLGKPLKESPHVGAEFVDDLGRSYDALGTPKASQFWNEKQFLNSIDGHLLKSNNFTVIDLTGFTPAQIAAVNKHLATLTPDQLARIIKIGF